MRGFRTNMVGGSNPTKSFNFITDTVDVDWVTSSCYISTHTPTTLKAYGSNFNLYYGKPFKINGGTQRVVCVGNQRYVGGYSNNVYMDISTNKTNWKNVASTSNGNWNFSVYLTGYVGQKIYVRLRRQSNDSGQSEALAVTDFRITES